MGRGKVVLLFLVVATAAIGISYSAILSSQPASPSTNNANCSAIDAVGNFTSYPEMGSESGGPYNITVNIQNVASQSVAITQYTDNNGLTQSVSWNVPAYTTESFQTTVQKAESSLTLETSCNTSIVANLYQSTRNNGNSQHYDVTLYVSLGGTAH